MTEVKLVHENADKIRELMVKLKINKDQQAMLREESQNIVDMLNSLLPIDLQSETTQRFDADGLVIKANPKINRTVNSERLAILLNEDPYARELQDIFKEKYELQAGPWKALTPKQKAIFAVCVTEKSGKTEYSIEEK